MKLARPRRLLLQAFAATLAFPALASSRRTIASMTVGPFYPPRAWRERQHGDWDADLTRVARDGRVLAARGERLGLEGRVVDAQGRIVDGAEVEIWQCDALGHYTHPSTQRVPAESVDAGFQGFGSARSDAQGIARFVAIRPHPYPGRTPHIHIRLRHPSFGERISQLFVENDPGNAGDFLWRSLDAEEREALAMRLVAAPAASGLRWQVRQDWVVPG
ncbi:MAG TPA: intradiol ring-cleavage dioxygenase [Methylibium sp.]|uniref:dioxygenase family protein n=1 Tax=Methylibium sp. TaxID=2067992 RepID=UPI002DB5C74F|nr:intradiol ring-cleavage dioxygenase [Methylibium sp.]HEU4460579.1 intradiol ring-cleavage dioxygenase [Methylibium sp.]